jgi:hypothetical protein
LKDESRRLRVWGNDTGASSRSLDHALRKSSRLQTQVADLLRELLENIQKGGLLNLICSSQAQNDTVCLLNFVS